MKGHRKKSSVPLKMQLAYAENVEMLYKIISVQLPYIAGQSLKNQS